MDKKLLDDIDSFLRAVQYDEALQSYTTNRFEVSTDLIERLGRYRATAENAPERLETPENGNSKRQSNCLRGEKGCNCGLNGYSGQNF